MSALRTRYVGFLIKMVTPSAFHREMAKLPPNLQESFTLQVESVCQISKETDQSSKSWFCLPPADSEQLKDPATTQLEHKVVQDEEVG